jgi:hypothetical protein
LAVDQVEVAVTVVVVEQVVLKLVHFQYLLLLLL